MKTLLIFLVVFHLISGTAAAFWGGDCIQISGGKILASWGGDCCPNLILYERTSPESVVAMNESVIDLIKPSVGEFFSYFNYQ